MANQLQEIRDPIHVFVRLDEDELRVLNSRPFQRLRSISQLAMTYLVYPGATHRRFEHSLGVMEMATRMFDVLTAQENVISEARPIVPSRSEKLAYYRRALRMAALCHDIGHLPFSHAAESLLPRGVSHENITKSMIESDEMRPIWLSMTPPLRPDDVVRIAVDPAAYETGPRTMSGTDDDDFIDILGDIIRGGAFGADRMDYLLRDSHHTGVAYGRFDHYRLLDSLRLLRSAEGGARIVVGVTEGGLHSAEALLLARYYMFTQVYLHRVRRIYDIHLGDFLHMWLPNGQFPLEPSQILLVTDDEVITAMRKAATDPSSPLHLGASLILNRDHYRSVYTPTRLDLQASPNPGEKISPWLKETYGTDAVRHDRYFQKSSALDFPVLLNDGSIESARALSTLMGSLPVASTDHVYVAKEHRDRVRKDLKDKKEHILNS